MALTSAEMKRTAAAAALEHVFALPVFGVGSGTTVDAFIDVLAEARPPLLEGVVPASEASAAHLREAGIPVLSLADAGGRLAMTIDGCDEADPKLRLVKGAGGAMTREKVLASAAERFVVIGDERKLVERLGITPVPIEVLPMAETYVAAQLERLGGTPLRREGYVTDNGGIVLDTTGLPLEYPDTVERTVAAIPGVVGSGLFALRSADLGLFATADGEIRTFVRQR